MKQRLTYFLPEGSGIDPSDIKISEDSLNFTKAAQASEEWRLTRGPGELPEEVGLLDAPSSLITAIMTSSSCKLSSKAFTSCTSNGLHRGMTD